MWTHEQGVQYAHKPMQTPHLKKWNSEGFNPIDSIRDRSSSNVKGMNSPHVELRVKLNRRYCRRRLVAMKRGWCANPRAGQRIKCK